MQRYKLPQLFRHSFLNYYDRQYLIIFKTLPPQSFHPIKRRICKTINLHPPPSSSPQSTDRPMWKDSYIPPDSLPMQGFLIFCGNVIIRYFFISQCPVLLLPIRTMAPSFFSSLSRRLIVASETPINAAYPA